MATTQKNIVILGGSYAGISTAHYLLKHVFPDLPNPPTYRLVLISTSNQALCRPACPRAMISDSFFDQQKLFVDIKQCFDQYPANQFESIEGTATSVDLEMQSVAFVRSGVQSTIPFHSLVIATGASAPSALHGLLSTPDDLRAAWRDFRSELANAESILILGGGPTGVETAAELVEYSKNHPRQGKQVTITLVTSGSELLPVLRPSIARQAENTLVKLGVKVMKNTKIERTETAVDASLACGRKTKAILSDGSTIEAELYIPATGTSPNTSFIEAKLLDDSGRVQTDSTMRVFGAGSGVYAIGDASSFARPAIHNIFKAVPTLCANIRLDLLKMEGSQAHGEDRVFKEDKRETQMVLLGQKKAVGAALGWALPSVMVRLIKRDYWLWTTPKLWSGEHWSKAKY